MKCPYNSFCECIVEKCPSCLYETIEHKCIEGRFPHYMSAEDAVKNGYAWETIIKKYKFVSCKLTDNSVQIPNKIQQVVNNKNENNISVRKSIF